MTIESLSTVIFLGVAIISYAGFWYLWSSTTSPLISKAFYSKSVGLFILLALILYPIYLISIVAMAIGAGIGIGAWGALLYHSHKIKREERERTWKTHS